ncbi:MAG: VOC family protein [Coriobacteriia bacterium]|nr:VOC family protein [Coriobacteriia bacterium]
MERNALGEFSWIDLAARDLEVQTTFYEEMFGWEHYDVPTDQGPIYRMFTLHGATVAGASAMNPQMAEMGMPSMWNTYLAAPDVDTIAEKATELGGMIVMPAMDVMTEGRMVGIQDPTGGVIYFWQAGKHHGAQTFMEPGSLIWSELSTRDPETAAAFFAKLVGWDIQRSAESPTPYWLASVGGQPEGGVMMMPKQLGPEVPASWLVYFGVTNATTEAARAISLGADVNMEPMEAGNMWFAVLTDPAGAVFGIMTPMQG